MMRDEHATQTGHATQAGIAVVTGAAGGMGRHIAGRLHADGHRVLLTDIAVDAAELVAAELSPDGTTARAVALDVAHRAEFARVLDECRGLWGVPTILVNNAAVTQAADLMTLGEEDFTRVLTTNVNSIFFGCQILALVVEGLPSQNIARRLGMSVKTVDVHRARIKSKTDADSISTLVRDVLRFDVDIAVDHD